MFPRTQRSAKFTNYYSGPNGGHFAYEKTNEKLKNRFDWPGMKWEIQIYSLSVHAVQRIKPRQVQLKLN